MEATNEDELNGEELDELLSDVEQDEKQERAPAPRSTSRARPVEEALDDLEEWLESGELLAEADLHVYKPGREKWGQGEYAGAIDVEPLETLAARIQERAASNVKRVARVKTKDTAGRWKKGGELRVELAPVRGKRQAAVDPEVVRLRAELDQLKRERQAATAPESDESPEERIIRLMELGQRLGGRQEKAKTLPEMVAEYEAMDKLLGRGKRKKEPEEGGGLLGWVLKALEIEPVQELVGQFAGVLEVNRKQKELQLRNLELQMAGHELALRQQALDQAGSGSAGPNEERQEPFIPGGADLEVEASLMRPVEPYDPRQDDDIQWIDSPEEVPGEADSDPQE